MTDLEQALRSLSVEWPATPRLALDLAPRRSRRPLVLGIAVAAAVAIAFAVPASRGAILRFFHLGGVTVVHVETLPAAAARPFTTGLGRTVGDADATRALGVPFLPRDHGQLYANGGFISMLLRGPLLLSEFGNAEVVKKFVQGNVESVAVAPGVSGLWVQGRHDVFFFGGSPRLAGNVLAWVDGNVTFRLEGPHLERDDAIRLAREIIGTDGG